MSPSLAIAPIHPQASQALLRERLAQLEAALLDARGRVMLSFDRELASLRSWMQSLEHLDPSVGLRAVSEPPTAAISALTQEFATETPRVAAKNIVPFSASNPMDPDGVIEEPPVDPCLASATLDELNAALTAAFKQMSEK